MLDMDPWLTDHSLLAAHTHVQVNEARAIIVSLAAPIGTFEPFSRGQMDQALALQTLTCRAGRCTNEPGRSFPEHRPAARCLHLPCKPTTAFCSCPKWNWSQQRVQKPPNCPVAVRQACLEGEGFFRRHTDGNRSDLVHYSTIGVTR